MNTKSKEKIDAEYRNRYLKVLKEATNKGWIDPGVEEPLYITAMRANSWLRTGSYKGN